MFNFLVQHFELGAALLSPHTQVSHVLLDAHFKVLYGCVTANQRDQLANLVVTGILNGVKELHQEHAVPLELLDLALTQS